MNKIRISKFLAKCGIDSRRKCENLVKSGKIKVNGNIVRDLAFQISEGDEVKHEGEIVSLEKRIVLALNKPPGYLSTVKDDFNRKTVLDLLDNKDKRLYPVGRLDYNSRGLIIITNDGKLAYRITHPKFEIPKTYAVILNKNISQKNLDDINSGIKVGKRIVNVKSLKVYRSEKNVTIIEIKIIEGRKRIIRRLFKKLGYKVIDLKRIKIGNLGLGNLEQGKTRLLGDSDIKLSLMEN